MSRTESAVRRFIHGRSWAILATNEFVIVFCRKQIEPETCFAQNTTVSRERKGNFARDVIVFYLLRDPNYRQPLQTLAIVHMY